MHYTQELAEYDIVSIFYIMYIKHRIIQYKIINVKKDVQEETQMLSLK